jgi:hypothetical protein
MPIMLIANETLEDCACRADQPEAAVVGATGWRKRESCVAASGQSADGRFGPGVSMVAFEVSAGHATQPQGGLEP